MMADFRLFLRDYDFTKYKESNVTETKYHHIIDMKWFVNMTLGIIPKNNENEDDDLFLRFAELKEWCEENCEGKVACLDTYDAPTSYCSEPPILYFEKEEDATLFTLTWC